MLAEFDSLTTEIGTMMNTIQPVPGAFDFREADAVADLAEQAHKDFQIHPLLWDPLDQPQWNIVPPAIRAMLPGRRHQFMLDSVTTIMQRYAGLASTVTVVNEAFDQMGPVAMSTFSTHFGPPALPTRLYYNEHTAETNSDKSNAVYDLVKRLHDTTVDGKATTMPLIDGVGFQGHMLGGKDQRPDISDIETNLQLDVRIP